ncbi:hypothetical protein L208DRAFT_1513344, partial [Tricholoma matsutake]
VKDNQWVALLARHREGACTEDDIAEVRKLVLTNKECNVPNFTMLPWSAAVLVMPCNSVQTRWNAVALHQHCTLTSHLLYIVLAEDTMGKERSSLSLEAQVIVVGTKPMATEKLEQTIEIAVGMIAMVTLNIATEADVANRMQGEIVDIVLDPRETVNNHSVGEDSTVILCYLPSVIIFRPLHCTFPQFPGLQEGLIPIFPAERKFMVQGHSGGKIKVTQRQLGLTVGYTFTDYKAQGQTLEHVIVDLTKLPRGSITPFGAYIALSRSRGRHNQTVARFQ